MKTILERITKVSIYLLVFLLPLFWLPFSFEAFEFNKQYLLLFLVSLAFLAHLAKMVLVDRKIKFRTSPLDIFVGFFMLIAIFSAIFSADKGSSLFGFYGRFSDGLIGLLSLGVFYFLITNSGVSNSKLLKTFLWSTAIIVLTSYLSIFSVWSKLSFLPQVMRQRIFNPTAGSLEGLAVFLSIIIVLLVGKILFEKKKKISLEYFLLATSLGLLIIINFSQAWKILLVSLTLFLGFVLWKRLFKENAGKLFLPLFLMILAIFSLSVNVSLSGLGNLPREQVLSQGMSLEVAFGAATDSVKSAFLGSGIGTWHYDFAKQKPVEFNQTRLWQIRFDRPGSYLAEIIGTMGLLGLLSWLALIGMFLLISYFLLQSANTGGMPLLMTFVALLVSSAVYYQNTAIAFTFWLVLGLNAASWQRPIFERTLSFKNFPELNLVFNTVLIMIAAGAVALFYSGGVFYLADKSYAKIQKTPEVSKQISLLEKAVYLNPYSVQYRVMLSRAYLQEVQLETAKPAGEQNPALLQARIADAIESGKQAILLGPGQVAAVETLAMTYRDIRLAATGAQDWSIKYFEKAIELEPTNPVLRTELAKVLAESDPNRAKAELKRATELKPDYLDAFLQEITLLEQEGNLDGAAKKAEKLVQDYPYNIDALFQLGRVYYNENKIDDAIFQLEKVIAIFPNHSNALYILGAAEQKNGMKEKARSYFEKVLELNPDNQDVQKRLKELK
ncbi:MAG: tetratricopeptide repeat protein [Candidatus Wildermuthbacteria bacterium]|nr:tetratricopeptide repeat protein [Candidatus Wildermuthbacteria bacterium]